MPAEQATQPTVARGDALPAPHAVQFVAPTIDSVLVIHPAWHCLHLDADAELYQPAAHAVQLIAPVIFRESVTDPAPHTAQATVEFELN